MFYLYRQMGIKYVDKKKNHSANRFSIKSLKIYGWAFWNWNYVNTPPQNFNLINVTTNNDILPTKYFYILKIHSKS